MAAQTQTPAKNKEKKNFHQSIARSDTGCFFNIDVFMQKVKQFTPMKADVH